MINTTNQFNTQMKVIKTDSGTEFLSSNFQFLIKASGIEHQLTCIYTPQQNGIVERKHRHILEVARALMKQSNIPIIY